MMKFAALALFIALAFGAKAQHSVGFKSGATVSNANTYFGSVAKAGFSQGLAYEYQAGKHFFAGVDVLFQQRGFKVPLLFSNMYGIAVSEWRIPQTFNYLSAGLRAGVNAGELWRWHINAVLTPAFLASAHVSFPNTFENVFAYTAKQDITGSVNRFDLAAGMEGGVYRKLNEQFSVGGSVSFQHSVLNYADWMPRSNHYFLTAMASLKYAIPGKK